MKNDYELNSTYSALTEQRKAEIEEHRLRKASYTSDRRLWLERVTFAFALVAAVLYSLGRFGIGSSIYGDYRALLTVIYFVALVIFAGDVNLSRVIDKFVAQERTWQLILVILLPLAARLLSLFFVRETLH